MQVLIASHDTHINRVFHLTGPASVEDGKIPTSSYKYNNNKESHFYLYEIHFLVDDQASWILKRDLIC